MEKKKILSGLSWSFAEKVLTDIVGTLITIILARLLYPEDYGLISLIQVFINISLIFVDCGMCTALIQNKDTTQEQVSTIFYLNTILGIIIYIIVFISAPYISSIKGNSELTLLLRVLAIKIPISSVYSIQHAFIQKRMQFKKFFFSSFFGTVAAGIVGISMAYKGYGAWALVISNLVDQVFDCIILFITTKWIPSFKINLKTSKNIIVFGGKILFVELITRLANNVRSLIIGFKYTSSDLAFNSKGQKYPQQVSSLTNSVVTKVMFPVLSEYQDNLDKMREVVEMNVKITSFILMPMMFGFLGVANKFVPLLLTDKWNGAIIYIQIYCLAHVTIHISSICTRVVQACGKGNFFIKLQTVKIILSYMVILLSLFILDSPLAIALSVLVSQTIDVSIDIYSSHKLINYNFLYVIKDTYKTLISCVGMSFVVLYIGTLFTNDLVSIIIQIIVGALIYVVSSVVMKNESFNYILSLLRRNKV